MLVDFANIIKGEKHRDSTNPIKTDGKTAMKQSKTKECAYVR